MRSAFPGRLGLPDLPDWTRFRPDSGRRSLTRGARGQRSRPSLNQGREAVSIGRTLVLCGLAASALPCWGCGLTPLSHRKVQLPPASVRARTLSGSPGGPAPAKGIELVARLSDSDPVVRMAAHEELRRRTGQDFGYVAWGSPEERAAAAERWKSYVATIPEASPTTVRPAGLRSHEHPSRRPKRRRRSGSSELSTRSATLPSPALPPLPATSEEPAS